MEFLDSDSKLLTHNGQTASRDIVQFVGELRNELSVCACLVSVHVVRLPVDRVTVTLIHFLITLEASRESVEKLTLDFCLLEMRKFYGAGPPAQGPGSFYGHPQQHFDPTTSYIQRSNHVSKTQLAASVLAELPDQLTLWMKKLKPVI